MGALKNNKPLPRPIDDAIIQLVEGVVSKLADEYPKVKRWRATWIRNVKAHLASRIRRGIEDDFNEAFK